MTTLAEIDRIFESQVENYILIGKQTSSERKKRLRRLCKAVVNNQDRICAALKKDLNRPETETKVIEIYPLVHEIRHAIAHLSSWMSSRSIASPLMLMGTRSRVIHRSKGVVLIISPWNFPLLLTLSPLIYALAAGNCAILKPSELTPAVSEVIKEIISSCFDDKEVAVILGDKEESEHLLKKPFNHIFFTGSPRVGRIVMKAAAVHLASVTLELGGKSPVVLDDKFSISKAVKRIAWAKWLNAGQICVAPDYILVPDSKCTALVDALQKEFETYKSLAEKTHIVNEQHAQRLHNYLDSDVQHSSGRKIEPQIVVNPPTDHPLHHEEIFGPIFLILTYKSLEDAIHIMQSKPRPLVSYIFSKSNTFINQITEQTRSGAICINHSNVYYFNPSLPFGGSQNSGIGRTHGKAGFDSFSNITSEFRQVWPFSLTSLIYPPYNKWKEKLVNMLIKWL